MVDMRFILRYKKAIFVLFFLSLISSSFLLISPYISKLVIDQAFLQNNMGRFVRLSVVGAVLFILSILCKVVNDVIRNRISVTLRLSLANQFLKKLYSLDTHFFQGASTGENIYRLSDLQSVSHFLLEQVPGFLVDMVKLPFILWVCFWINLPMTAALIVLSPLFILQSVYMQKKLKPIYESLWRKNSLLSKELYESFSSMFIIKALGSGKYNRHRYLRLFIDNVRWQIKNFRWELVSSVGASFFSKVIYGAITLYGGWMIIKGRMTLGSYTAVMIYLTQLGSILQSLGYRFEHITQELISLEKYSQVMDLLPKITDSSKSIEIGKIKRDIVFEDIHFGYEREKTVFEGIRLTIPVSSWTVIVGQSGCGKTTLVNLFLRLYDPWQGRICLDGIELSNIKQDSLRKHISVATQQPFLFDRSIKENIAYGLKDKSFSDIEEAARIACSHDFITRLPQGYDAIIGEDACRLSFGQKQRIAIARALLRRPDILILDEAMSSVDPETEERIIAQIKKNFVAATVVIVSHRLATVFACGRVCFIKSAQEIVVSSPSELLNNDKDFARLFASDE